jgi:hypothetical protein
LFLVAATILILVNSFDLFREGVDVTAQRFSQANTSENVVMRIFNGFWTPIAGIWDTPLLGFGLGVGTNVGAALLTGRTEFLLAEGEWGRVILESGPVLGLLFLLWRLVLAGVLTYASVRQARRKDCLPLLLAGAGALPIVNAQLGQATIAGFTVLGGALILTALMHPPPQGSTRA